VTNRDRGKYGDSKSVPIQKAERTAKYPNHAKNPILSRGSRGSRFKKKFLRRGFGKEGQPLTNLNNDATVPLVSEKTSDSHPAGQSEAAFGADSDDFPFTSKYWRQILCADVPPSRLVADLCSLAPLVLSILYFVFAAVTRFVCGHWPRYSEFTGLMNNSLFFTVNDTFMLWGVFSLCGAPLIWGALHCFKRFRPTLDERRRQILAFIAGWVLFILLLMIDLYGFSSFIIDG
jgi:hypothetical protein